MNKKPAFMPVFPKKVIDLVAFFGYTRLAWPFMVSFHALLRSI
jgi:hypothetical protein